MTNTRQTDERPASRVLRNRGKYRAQAVLAWLMTLLVSAGILFVLLLLMKIELQLTLMF